MDSIAPKKRISRIRKPNWTVEETQILLEELINSVDREALFGPITPINNLRRRFNVWQKIANSVSSIGVALRTVDETKSKWKMLKKEAMGGNVQGQGETKNVDVCGERLKDKFMLFKEMVRAVMDKASSYQTDGVHVNDCEPEVYLESVGQDVNFLNDSSKKDCEPEVYLESVGQDVNFLNDSNVETPVVVTTTSTASSSHADSTVFVASPLDNIKVEPINDVPDVETDMNQPSGFKTRLLKRKLPSLRARYIHTPKKKRQKTDDDDSEESALFRDYLKSEIKKNELICEQIRTSMEESKERHCREKEESKERLMLYRNLNKKLLGVNLLEEAGVKIELAEHAAKVAFTLDETFV